MTSSIPAKQSEDSSLIFKFLKRYSRRYRKIQLTSGISITALCLLLPLPLCCLADRFLVLAGTTRVLMWIGYVILLALAFGFLVVRRMVQKRSDLQVAFAVGDQAPAMYQSMAASLELRIPSSERENFSSEEGISTGLIEETHREAAKGADQLKIARLLPFQRARKLFIFALLAAGLQLALFAVPHLEYPSLILRFLNPFGNYDRVSGISFEVTPGNTDAGDGETVIVEAKISDGSLTRMGLYRGGEGMKAQRFEMTRVKAGRFRFTLPNLRRDVTYYLKEGNHQTREYRIQVRRRPRLENFQFKVNSPTYTSLKPILEDRKDGNFSVLAGSKVQLNVKLDIPVRKVYLRDLSNPDTPVDREMSVENQTATLEIQAEKTIPFQIVAFSKKLNQENANRLTFLLDVVPDRAPAIRITEPTAVVLRNITESQQVSFEIRDEFSIQEVRIVLKKTGEEALARTLQPEGLGKTMASGKASISLSELRLKPGDHLLYRVEARDLLNQWGKSQEYRIQIPVAAGDRHAAEIARKFGVVRRGIIAASQQLTKTHKTYTKMLNLFAPDQEIERPP